MDNNRTERLVCLANPEDAQVIISAAKATRMTVSTFLLLAGLEKANHIATPSTMVIIDKHFKE